MFRFSQLTMQLQTTSSTSVQVQGVSDTQNHWLGLKTVYLHHADNAHSWF